MRLTDLNEAPIGNIDYVGNTDHSGYTAGVSSFRHRTDQAIIGSEKAQAKIRRVLAKVPQTIDLCFLDMHMEVDNDNINAFTQAIAGVYDYSALKSRYEALPQRSADNAIMCVLTQNEGFERVQLSPWIIAHRMGHGIVMDDDYEVRFQNVHYVVRDLKDFLYDAYAIGMEEMLYAVCTMKSAREKKLTTPLEVLFELFAQTVVTGKVTLNRFTLETFERFVRDNSGIPYGVRIDDSMVDEFNRMLASAERQITRAYADVLQSLEGKVVIL